jgi:hypothetical protein
MAVIDSEVRKHISTLLPNIDDLEYCNNYLDQVGVSYPVALDMLGYQKRLLCSKWWTRALSRKKDRSYEANQIVDGLVKRGQQLYSSDATVLKAVHRAQEAIKYFDSLEMVSDSGETVDMTNIVEHSIANPNNRRAELMIRIAGFEVYAYEHNFIAEFYTITCPSRFHRYSGNTLNTRFDTDCNPKAAQIYLTDLWANIRKKFDRQKIKPFGFRVAEPHHDGCPHWHMLLFIMPEQRDQVRQIIHDYALADSSDEKGASPLPGQKPGEGGARFKAVAIDSNVGSATGYIAKYISKNLGFDLTDPACDISAKSQEYGFRVKAWSSVWGIRQFQQIGGAPVTIWRQLRKLPDVIDDPILEQARLAADQSRWADFLNIMGGADAKRIDMPIELLKKKQVNLETGEMKTNRYGEVVSIIYGVSRLACEAITRTKQWIIVKKGTSVESTPTRAAGGGAFPWSPVNNCPPYGGKTLHQHNEEYHKC